MLGPVCNVDNGDQHVDRGDVAAADNGNDPARVAGVGRGGLADGDGDRGRAGGHKQVPGHVGGVGRRTHGQPLDRIGQRAAVTVARHAVSRPSDVQK